jgi:signal transduction histidine kinase
LSSLLASAPTGSSAIQDSSNPGLDLVARHAQLQRDMDSRTAQLHQALAFESTLKRITDRVRDSLDERQIVQTAIQELATALNAAGCNAALYDLDQGTSTVCYEFNTAVKTTFQGRVAKMSNAPELYDQLLNGWHFQFCSLTPHPKRGNVAMLACPIVDDKGVLGDLWLINNKDHSFEDIEIRLVQQVANQCAIAIRQARLYQAAQSQVKALERLNQLKDDFLSTVSHELRTPMSNMKMAIEMLTMTIAKAESRSKLAARYQPESQSRAAHYLQILRAECEREINLINDLLALQQVEASEPDPQLQPLSLGNWLPPIVSSFEPRTQERGQTLAVSVDPAISNSTVLTHPFYLQRIVSELVGNACKYTPTQETIAVQASQDLSGITPQLVLTVSNTGVEIPAAELPRIFQKFYRIPNSDPWSKPGTGLGLALVNSLVDRLGGTIQAKSRHNLTEFTLRLPLRQLVV